MNLNKDQTKLINTLEKYWISPKKYFLLSGQAGVGKTTCVRYFLDALPESTKVCLCTPTNKAVKVLKRVTDRPEYTYKTIYSLLGLTLQANGSVKELKDTGQDNAGAYDLIVLDEASMLNETVLDYLHKKTALTHTKILLIGDKEQLPPVKASVSPIWERYPIDYELTEVMRHQNSILTFVQSIRANQNPSFVSPGKEVTVFVDEAEFVEKIYADVDAGLFHEGKAKAVAWRNITVDTLNKMIRERAIGEEKSKTPYIKGDRVIFTEPVTVKRNRVPVTIASVDDEGVVTAFEKDNHPAYPMFRILKVHVKLDDSKNIVQADLIDPRDSDKLTAHLKTLADKKLWGQFWQCKEAFHSISYAYALTAHRSQGSTFDNVYLEAGDIMSNRFDIDTRTKCLYVAASRAASNLFIFT